MFTVIAILKDGTHLVYAALDDVDCANRRIEALQTDKLFLQQGVGIVVVGRDEHGDAIETLNKQADGQLICTDGESMKKPKEVGFTITFDVVIMIIGAGAALLGHPLVTVACMCILWILKYG